MYSFKVKLTTIDKNYPNAAMFDETVHGTTSKSRVSGLGMRLGSRMLHKRHCVSPHLLNLLIYRFLEKV